MEIENDTPRMMATLATNNTTGHKTRDKTRTIKQIVKDVFVQRSVHDRTGGRFTYDEISGK